MLIQKFARESGFKVLAMARLSNVEYSVVLYLINCLASNFEEIITTDAELSSLVGHPEDSVRAAIRSLFDRNIIKVFYGASHRNPDIDSMRLGLQLQLSKWELDHAKKISAPDALVFPFIRQGKSVLQIVEGKKAESTPKKSKGTLETWRRVVEAFIQGRSFDDDELKLIQDTAKILVDTHPVDQVLLMVRHFSTRIPTLSLLASSWQHFQEIFEEETQKVDMMGARQKHLELDRKLREQAREMLNAEREGSKLSEDERLVLEVLAKHQHPRRQLFWAYQSRSRYPNLSGFFADNAGLMLAVTSSGKVIT